MGVLAVFPLYYQRTGIVRSAGGVCSAITSSRSRMRELKRKHVTLSILWDEYVEHAILNATLCRPLLLVKRQPAAECYCAMARCFSRHCKKSRNSDSRCSSVKLGGNALLLRNAANSPLVGCSSAASFERIRLSISSATPQRVQPGTLAARLTSRHCGWRGGSRNLSHLVNRERTNRSTRR